MSELIITRGIPASGKTTWAKAWVTEAPATRLRVNRDDLRRMLYGVSYGLDYKAEQGITRHQQAIVKDALANGVDVVIDDTNLRARFVKAWFAFSENVRFVDFKISAEDAVLRDSTREHSVGAEVIRSFAAKFLRKGELPPVPERPETVVEVVQQYEPDDNLDPAVIFDIDGTLAHIREGGRSPYDGTRVHEDTVDVAVARMLNQLDGLNRIIIMSGRDAKYRPETEKWLRDNNIRYDEFYMRPEGDVRKDHVVKLELFDAHVRDRFAVHAVFDDRNRVVEMWRSIGLKCMQVQEGNF